MDLGDFEYLVQFELSFQDLSIGTTYMVLDLSIGTIYMVQDLSIGTTYMVQDLSIGTTYMGPSARENMSRAESFNC